MEIQSPRSARRARIEIIPLIDIIFFLLATFVIVSLSMIKNQGIPVRLPTAAAASPQERKGSATISVAETGQLFLDKEELTLEQISTRLGELKAQSPEELRVFINGDENARLGLAIAVLDATRKLGISKVAFQTKALPPPATPEQP
jgi:biopolymer transport protein ExbD